MRDQGCGSGRGCVEVLESRVLLSSAALLQAGDPTYQEMVVAPNQRVFFTLNNSLWSSDGTAASTGRIAKNLIFSPSELTIQGDSLFLTDSSQALYEVNR